MTIDTVRGYGDILMQPKKPNEYQSLVSGLDADKWYRCRIIADWCDDRNLPNLARAWRWIADNKRWPMKHRERELYGWYMVPMDEWEEYRRKRESSLPNVLVGGNRVFQGGTRRARQKEPYMRNQYVSTVSQAMGNLARGLAIALAKGEVK